MYFKRIKTPGLGHNSYLVGCGKGEALVVDPRRDIEEYVHFARENDLAIRHVLVTHRQEDFELGSTALAAQTGAKVVGGTHELFGRLDMRLEDGDELEAGTMRIVALSTPGHTPESMTYAAYAEDSGDKCWGVFSGDCLFVGDTGRTDLPDPEKAGENAGILYDSVHRKIAPLGDQALLYPAHGAGSACGANISDRDESTIGIEKATNPVFKLSRSEFVEHVLSQKISRPPHFSHMEEVNLLGGRPEKHPDGCRVLSPQEFQKEMRGALVIDTRSPESFAASHVARSYNAWVDGLATMGGWIASEKSRILLIAEDEASLRKGILSLSRIGIDGVDGALAGGIEAWQQQGLPTERFPTTSAQECAAWMQEGRVHVIDVRDQHEWDEKHIPGAGHRFVGHLEEKPPQLPKDSAIVVHCNVGHRSGVAASILRRLGFTNVVNMLGGLKAWEKLGLPLERGGEKKQ